MKNYPKKDVLFKKIKKLMYYDASKILKKKKILFI